MCSFNGATASPPWKRRGPGARADGAGGLQWSHGVAAVETRPARSGAAHGRSLQWSHGVAAVETLIPRVVGRARGVPSMEPRRRRRGNPSVSSGWMYRAALQWSHGVAAVETGGGQVRQQDRAGPFNGATASPPWKPWPDRASPPRWRASFNGATASPPWKPVDVVWSSFWFELPSMEPRRRRRGNRGAAARAGRAGDPSMEPRRRRRGNLADARAEAQRLVPSMEPRRRRRGNRFVEINNTAALALQWSHGVAAVETARAAAPSAART